MKISFEDNSYIEFIANENNLCISMCGKKEDGSTTHSSSFITKNDCVNLFKFLLPWLEK